MPEITPTGKTPPATKFQAHGVQSPWLNAAKGKSIEAVLDSGDVLNGRLVGHDIYCLSLEEAGQTGNTLIYKQSISFIRLSKG